MKDALNYFITVVAISYTSNHIAYAIPSLKTIFKKFKKTEEVKEAPLFTFIEGFNEVDTFCKITTALDNIYRYHQKTILLKKEEDIVGLTTEDLRWDIEKRQLFIDNKQIKVSIVTAMNTLCMLESIGKYDLAVYKQVKLLGYYFN